MPIKYTVLNNGHYIHAVAEEKFSSHEFIKYEIDHATDSKIKSPIVELFEIRPFALDDISQQDIQQILEERKKINIKPKRHKCALVVSTADIKGWDIAKFYEGMLMLHSPEIVIVFGDINTAKIWLGVS